MNPQKFFVILAMVAVVFASCKKEALMNPVGITNSPSGSDFISFKIDGVGYEIKESSFVGNSGTSNGLDSVYYAQAGGYKYNNSDVFFSVEPSSSLTMAMVVAESFSRISDGCSFVQAITPDNSSIFSVLISRQDKSVYSTIGNNASGTLTISRIEIQPGGRVEGTFDCGNLALYDKDGNLLSQNHILTEGKFRVTVN